MNTTGEVQSIDISKSLENNNAVSISPDAKISSPCITAESTSNCKLGVDKIQTIEGYSNLPDAMKLMAKNVMTVGDSVSAKSSISGSVLSGANSLGKNAISAKNKFESMKREFNKYAKKNGRNEIDFDKKENELLASLNAVGARELASKGITARDFMASVNTSNLGEKKNNLDTFKKVDNKSQVAVAKTANKSNGNSETKKPMEFKFNMGDVTGAGEMSAEAANAEKAEYDMGAVEVHKNADIPIWTIISNRYIRSAYPKLLEEEPAPK